MKWEREGVTLILGDCMAVMAKLSDNAYDLAICDPPYGLGNRISDGAGKLNDRKYIAQYRENPFDHATPQPEYFTELRRVSRHQIIWGGNYFPLPPTRGVISWDKVQEMPTFSQFELGWTSFDCVSRIFRGRSQDSNRIHPTQKPVALYKWLLANYAKPGDRILDTHLGSGSSVIAALDHGFEILACEIDADYYAAAVHRIDRHRQQGTLWKPGAVAIETTQDLFTA